MPFSPWEIKRAPEGGSVNLSGVSSLVHSVIAVVVDEVSKISPDGAQEGLWLLASPVDVSNSTNFAWDNDCTNSIANGEFVASSSFVEIAAVDLVTGGRR